MNTHPNLQWYKNKWEEEYMELKRILDECAEVLGDKDIDWEDIPGKIRWLQKLVRIAAHRTSEEGVEGGEE